MSLCYASQAQTSATEMEAAGWKKIAPSEIVANPIAKIGSEWMALASGRKGDMNAMTVSWGSWGMLWNRPVVTVYVSSSRHTHSFMERNDYFTLTGFPAECKSALAYIGSHSGRDGNKTEAAGLTAEFTPLGNPIFREADLAIECKIIYREVLDRRQVPEQMKGLYERGTGMHSMYIGEIVNVWVKE